MERERRRDGQVQVQVRVQVQSQVVVPWSPQRRFPAPRLSKATKKSEVAKNPPGVLTRD